MFRCSKSFFSLTILISLTFFFPQEGRAAEKNPRKNFFPPSGEKVILLPKKVELKNQEEAISKEYLPKIKALEVISYFANQEVERKGQEFQELFPLLNPKEKAFLEKLREKVYRGISTEETLAQIADLEEKENQALKELVKKNWHIKKFVKEIIPEAAWISFCLSFFIDEVNSKYYESQSGVANECNILYNDYLPVYKQLKANE